MKKENSINEKYIRLMKDWAGKLNIPLNEKLLEEFETTNFPTTKDENWRFTSVTSLLKEEFLPSIKKSDLQIDFNEKKISNKSHTVVINNGFFDKENSELTELDADVIIDSLKNVRENYPELVEKFSVNSNKEKNAFELMNNIFGIDGLFIYVPKGKVIEKPIEVIFVSGETENNLMITPRNFILAEEHSEAKIIFNSISFENQKFFMNYSNEVKVGKNSNIEFYEFRTDENEAFILGSTYNSIEEGAVYNHYSFDLNGKFIRNNFRVDLNGENIECHLYGFYIGQDSRHVDNHTYISHNKPNCFSNEIYKGILDEKSKAVFSGRIYVAKDAQKTNAYQSNKTILLSDTARIDTKPQLEIYADDVKCTHGATVGQLDKEMLFYIISRGIPKDKASSMLIGAFASDVIEGIKISELKENTNQKIIKILEKKQ